MVKFVGTGSLKMLKDKKLNFRKKWLKLLYRRHILHL